MKRFTQILIIFTIISSLFLPSGLDFGGVREVQAADPVEFAVITGYGYANSTTVANVADMVNSWNPDFIVTAGDNSQGDTCDTGCYAGVVGAYYGPEASPGRIDYIGRADFWPMPGNHDYYADGSSRGLDNYRAYFTLPNTSPDMGESEPSYYDFVEGPVHFFILDSGYSDNSAMPNQTAEQAFLANALATSKAAWKIVVFHRPAYTSSSRHTEDMNLQWIADYDVDFLISGHNHIYERINKGLDKSRLFTAVIAGKSPDTGNSSYSGLEAYYFGSETGTMRVNATDTSIALEYYTANGTTYTQRDTYTQDVLSPPNSVNLNAFAGQTIYVLIEAADAGSASLVEAAIDNVLVSAE